jgi:hypothetical protein
MPPEVPPPGGENVGVLDDAVYESEEFKLTN